MIHNPSMSALRVFKACSTHTMQQSTWFEAWSEKPMSAKKVFLNTLITFCMTGAVLLSGYAFAATGGKSSGQSDNGALSGLEVTTLRNLNNLTFDKSLTDSVLTDTVITDNPTTVIKVMPPAVAAAPRVAHPFETLVEKSLGTKLKIFGQRYFTSESFAGNSYASPSSSNVPPDYTIAPGDELVIHAFGQISLDLKTVVDKDGSINLPQVGVLNVAGVSLKDISKHVKSALSQYYKGFDVSVSLGQLRSAQVYVTGFAERPGSYSVSALSTVINALFASGGPSNNGSLRAVELRRSGKTIAVMDLYKFLIFGDKSADIRIQSGDVIYIPPIKSLAGVAGTVNGAAIFELKPDTTVGELLRYAGGVTTTGQVQHMTLESLGEDRGRQVKDLVIDDKTLATKLQDGDMLIVLPQTPRFSNAVTLRGNVAMPIRYQWKAGMHISDLIPDQQALISPSYWLERNSSLDVDILASGRTNHEIKQTFPEINWDYATIERVNMGALNTSLIPFNLGKAVLSRDPKENIALESGDIITIFSKRDFRIPKDKLSKYVRIEGEVNQAGIYSVGVGESLRDVLAKAGGLTENAYLYGAELRREAVRDQQQKRMDEAISRLETDFQTNAISRSHSVTTVEEAQTLAYESASMKGLVAKMKEIKATGRIVLEVNPEDRKIEALPALGLENNDVVFIPPKPETVEVVGAVYNENSFIYKKEKTIKEYINQAGGFTPKANHDNAYILHADGSIKMVPLNKWAGWLGDEKLQPGDTIAISQDFEKVSIGKTLKDWSQIMYQFILGVGGLILLKGI